MAMNSPVSGWVSSPHPKRDMETALSLDAQNLLLIHVEGSGKANRYQKKKWIGPTNTKKRGSLIIARNCKIPGNKLMFLE